ncbi:MAG: 2-hydroxycarboxylate transporter family protein [Oligoflexales bacterium]|nr:2-hydroxycarboxylate transporter family protein [Oligoflexales bacterium]
MSLESISDKLKILPRLSWLRVSGFSAGFSLFLLLATIIGIYAPFEADGAHFSGRNILTLFSLLAVYGGFFSKIGDRLPLWNQYLGGGPLFVFFISAAAGTWGLIPQDFLHSVAVFYSKTPVNFLDLFIGILLVGSILSLERGTLVKSMGGYIPLMLIGLMGAVLTAVTAGALFGKTPLDVVINYFLPIMGGGIGGGAIPMSQILAKKTGQSSKEWFVFAVSILTMANIIAILLAVFLKKMGTRMPWLTGNGKLVLSESALQPEKEVDEVVAGEADYMSSLMLTGILILLATLLEKAWLMLNPPVEIHWMAFLVIITVAMNLANVTSLRVRKDVGNLQKFFAGHVTHVLMACVGFETDVREIVSSLTPANLVIAFATVLGAVGFIMLAARKMKFHPIEAGIAAGLCMASRGGSGNVAVLGAADRMELISFAQISTRIGGAFMLVVASLIFGFFC